MWYNRRWVLQRMLIIVYVFLFQQATSRILNEYARKRLPQIAHSRPGSRKKLEVTKKVAFHTGFHWLKTQIPVSSGHFARLHFFTSLGFFDLHMFESITTLEPVLVQPTILFLVPLPQVAEQGPHKLVFHSGFSSLFVIWGKVLYYRSRQQHQQFLGMGDCRYMALKTAPPELRKIYQFSAIIGNLTYKRYLSKIEYLKKVKPGCGTWHEQQATTATVNYLLKNI